MSTVGFEEIDPSLTIADLPRQSIDSFHILRSLGRDDSVETFLCEEPRTFQRFAVKLFTLPKNDPPMEFMADLTRFAQVSHPAILPPSGWNFGRLSGATVFVIITPFKPRIVDHGALTPTEKVIIVYGVASALRLLHSMLIAHTGVKRANILLDESNRPLLTDLGHGGFTKHEIVDIYGFGALFWEIIEGRPWDGSLPDDNRLQTQQIALLIGVMAEEPMSFEDVVIRLEDPQCWQPGADPMAFAAYKKLLEEGAAQLWGSALFQSIQGV
jgi:serine/threonine protein kinase